MFIGMGNDMDVALMQPTFMPWIGYFELMAKSEVFVVLDDFQFEYQSFGHRNRLFVNKGQVGWITIRVDKSSAYLKSYKEAKILENSGWRAKLWRGIEANYHKAPFWKELSERLYYCINNPFETLAEQNMAIICWVSEVLELPTRIEYSSNLNITGRRSEHVVNILRAVQADRYLCAYGSFDYMKEDGLFPLDDIEVVFQNANLKAYSQTRSTKGFVPYMSIIDALLNVGPDETKKLVLNTTDRWLSWTEMLELRNKGEANE